MKAAIGMAIVIVAASIGAAMAADAKPQFVATPKNVDEISRGQEDAMRCVLGYLGPTQISNCSFSMARRNAQDGSDTRYYNAGLTFETWRDLDVDWFSDQKLVKSGQVSAATLHDEETGTRAMYLLYRSARDAIGISDKELLAVLTKMNAQGKATTWTRLQFWDKQVH